MRLIGEDVQPRFGQAAAGEPVASLTTAKTTRASSITPIAPAATSTSGRRYQGVGGGSGCPGEGS